MDDNERVSTQTNLVVMTAPFLHLSGHGFTMLLMGSCCLADD